jgi:hypothetical protein
MVQAFIGMEPVVNDWILRFALDDNIDLYQLRTGRDACTTIVAIGKSLRSMSLRPPYGKQRKSKFSRLTAFRQNAANYQHKLQIPNHNPKPNNK